MNSTMKNVLCFVAGAACGACGVWYFVNKYYQEKFKQECAEFEQHVLSSNTPKHIGNMGITEKSKEVSEKAYKSRVNAEKQLIESYKESISPNGTAYNTINVKTDSKPDIDETEPIEDMPEEDEAREPYIISVEEYGDIEPYYDKVALIFDKHDDTLVDASNDELMSPYDTIGGLVYEQLDKFADDTYLYVRNDQIGTDYEVEIRNFEDVEL